MTLAKVEQTRLKNKKSPNNFHLGVAGAEGDVCRQIACAYVVASFSSGVETV